MGLLHLLHLFFVRSVHFLLSFEEFLVSSIVFLLLVLDLILNLVDLLLLPVQILLKFRFFILFLNFNLAPQVLDISKDFVFFSFFNEMIVILHVYIDRMGFIFSRILVKNVENAEYSILAS